MPFDVYQNYSSCHYDTSCPANFSKDRWWKVSPSSYKVADPVWGGTRMYAPEQGHYYNPYTGLFQTMKSYNPRGFRQDDW